MSGSVRRRIIRLRDSLDDFRRVRVTHGLRPAIARWLRTVIGWFFFRGEYFLVVVPLELITRLEPRMALTIRLMETDDLSRFAELKNKTPAELLWYRTLLERGRSCVIALCDDQLAAYGWFTTQVEPAVERTYVPLSSGDMFIFDLFTRPEFRRRGVQSALMGWMLEWGQTGGLTRALSLIRTDNLPSLNLHAKLGFQTLCRCTHTHFLGWSKFRFSPNPFGKAGNVIKWM